MTTLADSFLKDFDASSSDEDEEHQDITSELPPDAARVNEHPTGEVPDHQHTPLLVVEGEVTSAKLLDDVSFMAVVKAILDSGDVSDQADTAAAVASLQKFNDCLMRVDSEILRLFQACQDLYRRRFPELEALVPTPLDYLFVLRKLGNSLISVSDVNLGEQLSNATVLAVSVAASVSIGTALTDEQLEKVLSIAAEVDELVTLRSTLIERIEKSMAVAAPNLTAIVGFSLAARLVAHAGGLRNLATMPSQNLLVVGGSSYSRRTAAITANGGADPIALPQMAKEAGKGYGVIYESDLVQSTQPAFRSRALRLIVGKAALAVRKDVFKNDGTNTIGKQYRQLIVDKLKKVQAPPPARLKKPLPIPEERPRARRGGRRKRRWKEKYGMTELRKKANRLLVTIDTAAEPDQLQNEDDDDDDVF